MIAARLKLYIVATVNSKAACKSVAASESTTSPHLFFRQVSVVPAATVGVISEASPPVVVTENWWMRFYIPL
jgi:hypothetical protein